MNNIKESRRNSLESCLPLTFKGFSCVRSVKVNESYPCNSLGTGGRIDHLISLQMASSDAIPTWSTWSVGEVKDASRMNWKLTYTVGHVKLKLTFLFLFIICLINVMWPNYQNGILFKSFHPIGTFTLPSQSRVNWEAKPEDTCLAQNK